MSTFSITGGHALRGEIGLSGAKNAGSKLMIASLLTSDPVVLSNVPRQHETEITSEILGAVGATLAWQDGHTVQIHTPDITQASVVGLSRKNRISILALPALLHRTGEGFVPAPGGDKIGPRPVDFHLSVLQKMGAQIEVTSEGYHATAKEGLRGTKIVLPYPSVGATESAILAGVLARGRTVIENGATEPEVAQLIMMLQKMGAIIEIGVGREIQIIGVERLRGCEMRVMPDRLEAASYACMALGTQGEIFVKGAEHQHMITFLNMIRRVGGEYDVQEDGIVFRAVQGLRGIELETDTHPGFMTDWQQPFVVLLTQATGTSVVHETVYEERFGYTETLKKMGADITLFTNCLGELSCRFKGQNYLHSAVINGPRSLQATDMIIPDIRAGLALVIAALVAKGTSTLSGIDHLDRGYERLEEKLRGVGATIKRLNE